MCKVSTKKRSGIGNIKYGEIHLYYPIRFDKSLKFDKLCEEIEKSNILFSEEYERKISNSLQESMEKGVEQFKANNPLNPDVKLKVFNRDKDLNCMNSNNTDSRVPLDTSDLTIEVKIIDDSPAITLKYDELESFYKRLKGLQREFNVSKEIYGDIFVGSQQRYILLPFKIQLHNNEIVWVNCMLYVFENNMSILKLEVPLINVDTIPLKHNNPDLYIKTVIDKLSVNGLSSASTFPEIVNIYISSLFTSMNTDIIMYNNQINHIILTDFEGLPKNINTIPDDIQEDLYSIISSPLPKRGGVSYKNDAKEHLRNYSWDGKNIKYILKTTGGCLSITDQNILEHLFNEFKEEYEVSELTPSDYRHIYELLTEDISLNGEFALIIIILKKMTDCDHYFRKQHSTGDIFKTREDYYNNIIFVNELQEQCYGSATEQISAFESMMPYYLKKELTKSKAIALDKVLEQRKQKKIGEFQYFLATGGLILTILFGLPAIKDTLSIIRNSLPFMTNDIPYINLEGFSLFLWIISNLIIIYRIWNSRKDII